MGNINWYISLNYCLQPGNPSLETHNARFQTYPELVTICPPALRCLVYLWEQLCSSCVQIVQSTSAASEAPPPPTSSAKPSPVRHHVRPKATAAQIPPPTSDPDAAKKLKKKKKGNLKIMFKI